MSRVGRLDKPCQAGKGTRNLNREHRLTRLADHNLVVNKLPDVLPGQHALNHQPNFLDGVFQVLRLRHPTRWQLRERRPLNWLAYRITPDISSLLFEGDLHPVLYTEPPVGHAHFDIDDTERREINLHVHARTVAITAQVQAAIVISYPRRC